MSRFCWFNKLEICILLKFISIFSMQQLFSFNSDSERPRKQGGLYALEIGKNIGPFLPKDIMPNNPKSISLLVGSEIVKSHIVMVKTMEDSEMKMKKTDQNLKNSFKQQQQQGLTSAENLIDYSNFLENELTHIRRQTEQLHLDQRKFKMELEELQYKINSKNMQNTAEISPLLKELYSKVKESFNQEKNEMYKLTRDLEGISRQKSTLVQQIQLCEGRIKKLEAMVGINHHEYDQIESSSDSEVL